MSEASVQPTAPARRNPFRIALFSTLAVGIVALGFDLSARIPASRTYGKLNAMLDEEDVGRNDLSAMGPRTPTEIHKMLGLTPESSQKQADYLHETYSWPGVFRNYTVHAVYTGATLNLADPNDSEPLLSKVGYMAQPE